MALGALQREGVRVPGHAKVQQLAICGSSTHWYGSAPHAVHQTRLIDNGADVREPAEYKDGYIAGAINIPIKSQPDAMFLPEDEFEDRFGFSKPDPEKEVVFYCKSGVRSSAAAQFAKQHGYSDVAEYRGSWLDWQKHGGQAMKP